MHTCIRGLLAGAAATALLALLLWINQAAGPLPALDPIGMLARVLGDARGTAWTVFVAIGIGGYGLLFAALADEDTHLPLALGLGLAAAGWFAAMMALLPMAGYAPFGLALGWMVPLITAAWSVLFGSALAWTWRHVPQVPVLLQRLRTHDGTTLTAGS